MDVLAILAVLLGFAVLSGLAVLVAVLLAIRSLHRRNRVSPDQRSAAPLVWLSAPSRPARLHRRLRSAVAVARMIAGRATAGGQLSRTAELAYELEAEAVSIDHHLPIVARLAPRERTLALRRLAEQVNEVERLVSRLSLLEAEEPRPRAHEPPRHRHAGARPPARRPRGGPRRAAHHRSGRGARDRRLSPSGSCARLQALGAGGDGLGDQPVEGGGGPAVVDRRRGAASTPSAMSAAMPATTRPAAALSTTMSRWCPASPASTRCASPALTAGSPPRRSARLAGPMPKAPRVDRERAHLAAVELDHVRAGGRGDLVQAVAAVDDHARSAPWSASTRAMRSAMRRVAHAHHVAADPGRVGQRAEEVEHRRHTELAAGRPGVAHRRVEARREAEPDAGLARRSGPRRRGRAR